MKKIQLILAAVSLVGSSSLNAQATKQPKDSKEEKVYKEQRCIINNEKTDCNTFHFREDSTLIKRAAIGVSVQTTGTKRDTIGVFISRVTPDGPAEKAGIVEGDRIASINGVDLRVPAADVEDSYTAGIASHRLTRELEKLAPGATVRLQVVSGGRSREVQVTTVRMSELMKSQGRFGMNFPAMPMMPSMPNMRIFRDNLQPLMMTTPRVRVVPRTSTPMRIQVMPSVPRIPMDFYDEDDDVRPSVAPTPAAPAKPAKISARYSSSI